VEAADVRAPLLCISLLHQKKRKKGLSPLAAPKVAACGRGFLNRRSTGKMTGGWMTEDSCRSTMQKNVARSARTYAKGGLHASRQREAEKAKQKAKAQQRLGTGWVNVKERKKSSATFLGDETRTLNRSTLLMPQHQQRYANQSIELFEESTLTRSKPVTYFSNVHMGEFGLKKNQKKQAKIHRRNLRHFEGEKIEIRKRKAQNEARASRRRNRILAAEQAKNYDKFKDELLRNLQIHVCCRSTVAGEEWVTIELIQKSIVRMQSWYRGFNCRSLANQMKYKGQLIAARTRGGLIERTQAVYRGHLTRRFVGPRVKHAIRIEKEDIQSDLRVRPHEHYIVL
jgi:hypothetical protein